MDPFILVSSFSYIIYGKCARARARARVCLAWVRARARMYVRGCVCACARGVTRCRRELAYLSFQGTECAVSVFFSEFFLCFTLRRGHFVLHVPLSMRVCVRARVCAWLCVLV